MSILDSAKSPNEPKPITFARYAPSKAPLSAKCSGKLQDTSFHRGTPNQCQSEASRCCCPWFGLIFAIKAPVLSSVIITIAGGSRFPSHRSRMQLSRDQLKTPIISDNHHRLRLFTAAAAATNSRGLSSRSEYAVQMGCTGLARREQQKLLISRWKHMASF